MTKVGVVSDVVPSENGGTSVGEIFSHCELCMCMLCDVRSVCTIFGYADVNQFKCSDLKCSNLKCSDMFRVSLRREASSRNNFTALLTKTAPVLYMYITFTLER